MNIHQKLLKVQSHLKAPKGQYNNFGQFSYRSLEDILEVVKPLLEEYGLLLTLSDTVIMVGDRFYIEAKASLVNAEQPEERIVATAIAREALSKKGMDESQITGSTSSYARKYCMNGLFNIDDTKDADTHLPANQQNQQQNQVNRINGNKNSPLSLSKSLNQRGLTKAQLDWLAVYCRKKGFTDNVSKKNFMNQYGFSPQTTSPADFAKIQKQIEAHECAAGTI